MSTQTQGADHAAPWGFRETRGGPALQNQLGGRDGPEMCALTATPVQRWRDTLGHLLSALYTLPLSTRLASLRGTQVVPILQVSKLRFRGVK